MKKGKSPIKRSILHLGSKGKAKPVRKAEFTAGDLKVKVEWRRRRFWV